MGNNLWEKTIRLLGFGDDNLEERAVQAPPEEAPEEETFLPRGRRRLVPLPGSAQMKVAVVSPSRFEESQDIANQLKNRRPVILNLEKADKEVAPRILTFMSGVVYALNGQMQKIGNWIFLLTPNNVEVSTGAGSVEKEGDLWARVR
ncbi:MAG: cell division protein SepF [Firmicutes bacterium]|nr:cell division protein SepF [Bacillota bacterium]MCL5040797.1 cell division protein SepF [Bacillota bacterium]